MSQVLRVAIAGLGTVGGNVVGLLQQHETLLSARAGKKFQIVAVSARDPSKKRDFTLDGVEWCANAVDIAKRTDVDIVVELIGGAKGAAYDLAVAALSSGKHLVTANKALIATHGVELAALAEKNNVRLMFEAAVGGAVPVIKTLREALAANRITSVRGILNGTCNYILTRMAEEGADYAAVLKNAQELGYAEADPAMDVEGHDTAHKTAILAMLAFGARADLAQMQIAGITELTSFDLKTAAAHGYGVKLLGIARRLGDSAELRATPCLVPQTSVFARARNATSAMTIACDSADEISLGGSCAGGKPTASAVVADLIDVARGGQCPVFGVKAGDLAVLAVKADPSRQSAWYLRLMTTAGAGIVGTVTNILQAASVQISATTQSESVNGVTSLAFVTAETSLSVMQDVVQKISALPGMARKPLLLSIENA